MVSPHRNEMGTFWSPFFLLASRGQFGGDPRRFYHLIRSYTASTDTNTLGFAVDHGSHSLQIGKPTSLHFVVGMTDIVASAGSFTTNLADAGHIRATLKLDSREKLRPKKLATPLSSYKCLTHM